MSRPVAPVAIGLAIFALADRASAQSAARSAPDGASAQSAARSTPDGASAQSAARSDSRVVVVDDGDRSTRAATERLRGELAAAGFVVISRSARAGDGQGDMETATEEESVATVRLVRSPQARGEAELWVSDRLTGKTLVRRVAADPERSPRLVAMRGVELLRASLLELESPPHDDLPPATPALAQPPPPEIARFVAPAPARAGEKPVASAPSPRWIEHVALDAGIAVLASTDRLGPAAAPKLGVWFALPASFAARVQLVGPAFQGLSNAAGDANADVRQELATLDLAWTPTLGRSLAPFIALGGGAYHLHVQGTAAPAGFQLASSDVWAGLFAASVGLGVRLAPGVSLAAEGRALVIAPHPEVTIAQESVASAGSPSLLASASLIASF